MGELRSQLQDLSVAFYRLYEGEMSEAQAADDDYGHSTFL